MDKISLQQRISTLETKEGAEQFIAQKRAACLEGKETLSESMAWQMERMAARMDANPEEFVKAELTRLDRLSARMG